MAWWSRCAPECWCVVAGVVVVVRVGVRRWHGGRVPPGRARAAGRRCGGEGVAAGGQAPRRGGGQAVGGRFGGQAGQGGGLGGGGKLHAGLGHPSPPRCGGRPPQPRSEEHTSELQSRENLVCRLLLEKKKNTYTITIRRKKQKKITTT